MSPLRITDADKATALWGRLEAHYEGRLRSMRAKNDQPQAPEDTAMLRGRIAEIKAFLGLAEDPPDQPTEL